MACPGTARECASRKILHSSQSSDFFFVVFILVFAIFSYFEERRQGVV